MVEKIHVFSDKFYSQEGAFSLYVFCFLEQVKGTVPQDWDWWQADSLRNYYFTIRNAFSPNECRGAVPLNKSEKKLQNA